MNKKHLYLCIAILFAIAISILTIEESRIKTIEEKEYQRGYAVGYNNGLNAVIGSPTEQSPEQNYSYQNHENSAQQRRAQEEAQWHIQQAKSHQFMSENAGDQHSAEFWQREAQREIDAANNALNGY